ncbi:MAG TPA: hypothetical protein PKJ41_03845 [Bryobacteraceae bacterium]|nr:hypothetical protein [Bryobacteraceae bacterium]HPT26344.1 hypothetical protein [Bryobacteraceae bacterium]
MRLGDEVDDYCIKCKRLTNHFILAMMGQRVARVRCRTCYNEQEFRDGVPLPPRPRSPRKSVEKPPAPAPDVPPVEPGCEAVPPASEPEVQ